VHNNLSSLFLPCDATLAWYKLSSCVCPSVRLFFTSRHCTKTAKRRITKTAPYDNAETSFVCYRLLHNGHGPGQASRFLKLCSQIISLESVKLGKCFNV